MRAIGDREAGLACGNLRRDEGKHSPAVDRRAAERPCTWQPKYAHPIVMRYSDHPDSTLVMRNRGSGVIRVHSRKRMLQPRLRTSANPMARAEMMPLWG